VQPVQRIIPIMRITPVRPVFPLEPLTSVNTLKTVKTKILLRKVKEFLAQVKVKGQFVTVGRGTKAVAVRIGERQALGSLAATFRVRPSGEFLDVNQAEKSLTPNARIFRGYKVSHGQKIPLEDTWIQRRGKRLVTFTERSLLQTARRLRSGGFL
jgi:hypothetical protein